MPEDNNVKEITIKMKSYISKLSAKDLILGAVCDLGKKFKSSDYSGDGIKSVKITAITHEGNEITAEYFVTK